MKLSLSQYSTKLKPYKDFFVKHSKTIYFVIVAIIIGFLLVRVTTILLKQAPAVDLSEESDVKDVKTIKTAKYDVYQDSLNYCYSSSSSCVNTQIDRLLTNIAFHDNTLVLKQVDNNYSQVVELNKQINSIKDQLKPIIATGTYSDTISLINNALNIDKNKSSKTYSDAYDAVFAAAYKKDSGYYSNDPINENVKTITNLKVNVIKPAQEAIATNVNKIKGLKATVLKQQKANINSTDPHNTRYLIDNPNMPLLLMPVDIIDKSNPTDKSLYNVLTPIPDQFLTSDEVKLKAAVTELRNNVKTVSDKKAELEDSSGKLASAANKWLSNINTILPTSAILTDKNKSALKNNEEKQVYDNFANLDKAIQALQKPYKDNVDSLSQLNAKIASYVSSNGDDQTALKILSPSLSGQIYYQNDQKNPFVN